MFRRHAAAREPDDRHQMGMGRRRCRHHRQKGSIEFLATPAAVAAWNLARPLWDGFTRAQAVKLYLRHVHRWPNCNRHRTILI